MQIPVDSFTVYPDLTYYVSQQSEFAFFGAAASVAALFDFTVNLFFII